MIPSSSLTRPLDLMHGAKEVSRRVTPGHLVKSSWDFRLDEGSYPTFRMSILLFLLIPDPTCRTFTI